MSKLSENLPLLSIILPCYNEEEIIRDSFFKLDEFLTELISKKRINIESFICFVDDGSKDKTFDILQLLKTKSSRIHIVKLSKNFGHQAAILAGMEYSVKNSDCCVTIDADLQDDYSVIERMIELFTLGTEVIYGVRNIRTTDTFFKRVTAQIFYVLMSILGAETIKNHADFRLLSKRAVEYLFKFNEVNLFLRGIVPEIGLKSEKVYYERSVRIAGETKYPLKKMIAFAIEGITSFSIKPLRLVTLLGLIIILFTFIIAIYILISYWLGRIVQGWTSTIISIWFLGGVQLLSLGIIGEYVGKIYKESKKRPRYLIEGTY